MASRAAPLPGIRIGHWQDLEALTGCTVLLPEAGSMRAGVAVGGGAPATRETDLLAPTASIQEIHGLLLTGGSAFGLDAASGVMRYLAERNLGFDARVARVPIVPAAALFDLDLGSSTTRPDAAAGYAACLAASGEEAREGTIGAGTGAVVGRLFGGRNGRTKGGLGLAAAPEGAPTRIGVIAAVNAVGDVVDRDGAVIAGAREGAAFVGSAERLRVGGVPRPAPSERSNTTLVAVATSARMDKLALTRLARQAHDGLALAISPIHTAFDGDAVFALSTGDDEVDPNVVLAWAVELVAMAIRRAARAATSAGGVPAAGELEPVG
ncbi:MAG TPA: P1 family peptidase [Chloroflexota bacterium]|nr:P1 family peptidase [Chloroflexota bacterium]